nr:NepR family anti-sigma factor [Polymorphobacter sp.]
MNSPQRGALSSNGPKATPSPSTAVGDPVTAGLQRLFASIADEPIPEDFLRLLDEIEARAANDDGKGGGHDDGHGGAA